jgi:hypothetical protein
MPSWHLPSVSTALGEHLKRAGRGSADSRRDASASHPRAGWACPGATEGGQGRTHGPRRRVHCDFHHVRVEHAVRNSLTITQTLGRESSDSPFSRWGRGDSVRSGAVVGPPQRGASTREAGYHLRSPAGRLRSREPGHRVNTHCVPSRWLCRAWVCQQSPKLTTRVLRKSSRELGAPWAAPQGPTDKSTVGAELRPNPTVLMVRATPSRSTQRCTQERLNYWSRCHDAGKELLVPLPRREPPGPARASAVLCITGWCRG